VSEAIDFRVVQEHFGLSQAAAVGGRQLSWRAGPPTSGTIAPELPRGEGQQASRPTGNQALQCLQAGGR
jgi:hypothetical protein